MLNWRLTLNKTCLQLCNPMRDDVSNANSRDELLRDARQRLMRLEIETHRIKAVLARFEAEEEDAAADELSRLLKMDAQRTLPLAKALGLETTKSPAASPATPTTAVRAAESTQREAPRKGTARRNSNKVDVPVIPTNASIADIKKTRKPVKKPRRSKRPLLVSTVLHLFILLPLSVWTIDVLQQPDANLNVSFAASPEEQVSELPDHPLVPVELEVEESTPTNSELALPALEAASFEESFAESGDTVAADAGALSTGVHEIAHMQLGGSGGGSGPSSGTGNGPPATFFGSSAIANRVVFVVDNSNSMDEGRMHTSLAELARCVQALSPEQSFYVLFYSDTVYGMFHPHAVDELLPATKGNKQRLMQWLHTAEMCVGGRLVDAMRLVVRLEPDVVFLLSDGVMSDYPVDYITDANNNWPFTIHTIGMTVPDAAAAQNLARIAHANGGTFRSVGVSPLAQELAKRNPIKKNRHRGGVWGIKLPAR